MRWRDTILSLLNTLGGRQIERANLERGWQRPVSAHNAVFPLQLVATAAIRPRLA